MRSLTVSVLALTTLLTGAFADDLLEDRGVFQPNFFAELQDVATLAH